MASIRLRPIHPSAKTPEIPLARGDSKVVGRSADQADLVVDEPSLSRRHAQINVTPEGVVTVEDLGSTNHTFINDMQRKRGSLSSGDRVRFGSVEYELEKDVAQSESAEATVLLAATSRIGATKTLLVADDSATIRHFIELAFAAENITVVGVGNGDQAIDRIKSDPPDIVLADVDMPGKTGYEVVQFIRQSAHAHIPIVLLTDAAEADQARAEASGSDGVLGKPLDPHAVISRVKELIAKPRHPREPVAAGSVTATRPPAPAAPAPLPPAPASARTTAVPVAAPPAPPIAAAPPAPPPPMAAAPAPPAAAAASPVAAPPPSPPAPAAVAAPKAPAPPKPTLPPPLADVFAGLVASTPGEPAIPAMTAPPSASKADGLAVTDDLVNEVMRRVIEELSHRVVRETGRNIVADVAERLVREEIERLKSAGK